MILNFSAYNIISESVSLKELEKGNKRNLSYGDIKKGFLSKCYEDMFPLPYRLPYHP